MKIYKNLHSILLFALVCSALFFAACSSSADDDDYEVKEWDDGTKTVVIKDDDGSDILMDYLLFQTLINQGQSYGQIREYHHHHYDSDPAYKNRYSQIRTVSTTRTVKTLTKQIAPTTFKKSQSTTYGQSRSGVTKPTSPSSSSGTKTTTTTTSRSSSTSSRSSRR